MQHMIQQAVFILTALGVFFSGVSPLILHALKNMRRARHKKRQANESASQSGQGPNRTDWRKQVIVSRLVMAMLAYAFGIGTLMWLAQSKAPLTTGDAAMMILCLLFCLPTVLHPAPKD